MNKVKFANCISKRQVFFGTNLLNVLPMSNTNLQVTTVSDSGEKAQIQSDVATKNVNPNITKKGMFLCITGLLALFVSIAFSFLVSNNNKQIKGLIQKNSEEYEKLNKEIAALKNKLSSATDSVDKIVKNVNKVKKYIKIPILSGCGFYVVLKGCKKILLHNNGNKGENISVSAKNVVILPEFSENIIDKKETGFNKLNRENGVRHVVQSQLSEYTGKETGIVYIGAEAEEKYKKFCIKYPDFEMAGNIIVYDKVA